MNKYIVYILYSIKYRKIYIGYTSNLVERMRSHNYLAKKGYTTRFRPWIVIYTEVVDSKAMAIKREKELKSAKGRMFAWKVIEKKFE